MSPFLSLLSLRIADTGFPDRPESENQLTESEQLAIDAEDDGTMAGELKSEQKRQKEEKWARYTDTHRKGEGNTVNRG